MTREHIVIVGASLAGVRAAETLRAQGFDGRLTLVGAESALPYHRPPLSKGFLARETPFEELAVQPQTFFDEQRIELRLGTRATALRPDQRQVHLDSGELVHFDRALIATGSTPRQLSVPGSQTTGVEYLRSYDDARRVNSALQRCSNLVVVGAGLLGLEVASTARLAGKRVTIVEAGTTPLRRLVGEQVGSAIQRLHEAHGVQFRLARSVAGIEESGGVRAVELSNGTVLFAELVLVAIGVAPATDWLHGSGVMLDDGVLVDEWGNTSVTGVYAAGDVARFYNPLLGRRVRIEHYGSAQAQGIAVGKNMLGAREPYSILPGASSEQFGRRIQVIGDIQGDEDVILRGDVSGASFSAYYLRGGELVAVTAVGRSRDLPAAKKLILNHARVSRATLADEQLPLASLLAS